MKRLGCAAACAALLAAAGCATTEGDAATVAEADAGAVSCQEILPQGSNVSQRVCMTESEWEEYRRDRRQQSQAMTRRMQGLSGGF